MFSEEHGHPLKEKDTFSRHFSPPKVHSASQVRVGKATYPSRDSTITAKGHHDLKVQTRESLSHLPITLWVFPLLIIQLIAIFFNALIHPPPSYAKDPSARPETWTGEVRGSLLRCHVCPWWDVDCWSSCIPEREPSCPVHPAECRKSGIPSHAACLQSHTQTMFRSLPMCHLLPLGFIHYLLSLQGW